MTDDVDIERYLTKKDPDLGRAINIVRAARGERLRPQPSVDTPFQSLVRAIIYQRSSETSGRTVFAHLEDIAGGKLTPAKITALGVRDVKKAGLSVAKATYVKNVAVWFAGNAGLAKRLRRMSDEDVYDALKKIEGVGIWSVNVLLVFQFGRLDVAPGPDAVIRALAQKIYGLRTLPSIEFVRSKIALWQPYRSIATMYLYQLGKLNLTPAEIRRGRSEIDRAGLRSGT